jgi:hypothetical protein
MDVTELKGGLEEIDITIGPSSPMEWHNSRDPLELPMQRPVLVWTQICCERNGSLYRETLLEK